MRKSAIYAFSVVFSFLSLFFNEVGFAQDLENLKEQKLVTLTGSLGITTMFYHVTGRPASHEPFTWMLNGSPTLTIYGIVLPFSFTVSDQERDFRQPFNKFGVSPSYKWLKLHLGYRNLQFSDYTLGGHSILGAGIELNPGRFRFGFIAGRFMRPVPYSMNPADLNQSEISTPSYRRTGYSMKIGYGTKENFVDLILLKGKDDAGSITTVPGMLITPAENMVWSLHTRQKFTTWLNVSFEYAQSAFTRDTEAASDSLFSGHLSGFYKAFIHTNNTTSLNGAVDGSLELTLQKFLLNFHYKRIEPGYQSMGTYFFQNDIRNITIEPTVNLAGRKLIVNGSLGLQRDNLDQTRNFQTDRTIGSVHITWQPAQIYQGDVTFSNYDLGQKKGLTELDTLNRISQTTYNVMINQSLNFLSEKTMNTFMVSFNYQTLNDRNPNTSGYTEFTSNIFYASWFITLLKSGFNAGLSYNLTSYNMSGTTTKYAGPGISLGKNLFRQKLNLSLSWSSYANFTNSVKINNINLTSLRASFHLARDHKIQFRYTLNRNHPKDASVTSYRENKGEISYVYTF